MLFLGAAYEFAKRLVLRSFHKRIRWKGPGEGLFQQPASAKSGFVPASGDFIVRLKKAWVEVVFRPKMRFPSEEGVLEFYRVLKASVPGFLSASSPGNSAIGFSAVV